MADIGFIYRVLPNPNGDAWYHVHPHPLRYIPPGQGMGTFCQTTLGWSRIDIGASTLAELVENFGQGDDFT